MCLRTDKGEEIQSKTVWQFGSPSVAEAKAFGVLEVLNWLRGWSTHNIILETDSKQIADAFRRFKQPSNEFGSIITSCKNHLSFFNNFGKKLY